MVRFFYDPTKSQTLHILSYLNVRHQICLPKEPLPHKNDKITKRIASEAFNLQRSNRADCILNYDAFKE